MTGPRPLLGGVELGGTKCICFVGTAPDDIRGQISVPTGSDPETTLHRLVDQLKAWAGIHGRIAGLGIASFGPIDLAVTSPTYGSITSTAKPGWRNVDVLGRLAHAFEVPTGFDTDVNGAALAEGRWGAARGLRDFAYITVGTGVGVGLIVAGQRVHGFSHSELGHIRIVRQTGDAWPGACAFHGDCLEGLVSGPAIAARAGMRADQIPGDSLTWEPVAHALAQLLHTLMLTTAPRRILIGGGVVEARPALFDSVRRALVASLNGYVDLAALVGSIDEYVVAPGLGALAGPLGALALAADAYRSDTREMAC